MRFLIPLAVFLIMVVFLAIGLSLDPREIPSPLIGKPAPTYDLPTLESGVRLNSEALKGQAHLLNVWASWCEACRAEHPVLLDLARKGKVRIVGLNYKDTPEKALTWLKAHGGNPYDVVAVDADGRVGIDFGVYGVPETFVIDSNGIIRYKHTGPLTPRVLEETLLPLLESSSAGALAP
jgi:cytochrome c biogenesis protein CcmG/thiol:disulfide interchange protein DsbE